MEFNCNNKHRGCCSSNKYVSISKIKPKDWEKTDVVLGMGRCGQVFPVKKPKQEMTSDDREKLNRITVKGNGEQALFDDGIYRRVYTQAQTDRKVNDTVETLSQQWDKETGKVVFYEVNDTVNLRSHLVLNNGDQLAGMSTSGGRHTLMEVTRDNIVATGDRFLNYQVRSLTRPVAETFDGTSWIVNGIAYKEEVDAVKNEFRDLSEGLSDVIVRMEDVECSQEVIRASVSDVRDTMQAGFAAVCSSLAEADGRISDTMAHFGKDLATLTGRVRKNKRDIATLESRFTNNDHFRGYFLTTVEITLTEATHADFAWNAETGTVWIYDGTVPSWTDSLVPIPETFVLASDALPLVDGEASAGEVSQYSRGDHRHPSDPAKADIWDIPVNVSELNNDAGYVTAGEVPDTSGFVINGRNDRINLGAEEGIRIHSVEDMDLSTEGKLNYNGAEVATKDDLTGMGGGADPIVRYLGINSSSHIVGPGGVFEFDFGTFDIFGTRSFNFSVGILPGMDATEEPVSKIHLLL
ncbi:MAG: hypothetical protein LUF04_15285 [Bacteroides sp.]|nr:hypothetical protein [Bacteroides sp.]